MNELKSYTEYAVSTPTADFVIGFDFNYGEDAVNVTVDDVPATEAGYTVVYLNETTIRLSPSVPSGVVRLQRETDIDQSEHAYRAGAKFIAQTMDENFEQLRHSQQEVRDGFGKLKDDTYALIDSLDEAIGLAQDAAQDAQDAAVIAQDAADTVNAIIVGGKVAANKVVDESGKTQQEINTNQANKNSLTVDLLDFIPKSEWALILARISTYDCTPALTQAVATGKKVTVGQSGTYKLNTPYLGTTNFELEATAPNVVLDGNDNIANYVITNSGSVTKQTATFANPSKFDISITLSDVTGLKVGDWLCFYCPTDSSYSAWRAIYRTGEWKQIRSIVGNIVWFTKSFYDSYAGLALDLYKLNSVTCKLSNVKLLRTNGLSGFIKFSLSSDAGDSNLQLDLKVREGIFYDRCISPVSKSPRGLNIGTGTGSDNDYGVVYANCQHARIYDADIYSRRHAVALGGGNDVCSVPVSDFRCYDSVLSCDPAVGVGAADMHGNIRDSSYEDTILYGGSNIGGGEDCYYKRCKIYSDNKGVCGLGREIIGGNMGWIDCEYYSNGNPQPTGQAVITFGGNDVTTITEKTTKDVTIEVSGRVFGGTGYGSAVSFARVRNRGSSQKINVILDGLTFNNTSKFAYILNMDVVSGIANSDRIVVDNISGNMPSTNIVFAPETLVGQSYLSKPMRLQKVVGKTAITTTAGNFTASEVVNYPFSYPRRPLTMVSPRGVDGAQKNTFGGQRSVTFGVYSQGLSVMSAMVSSATAMTVGDVIEVVYSSEIKEC